MATDRKTGEPLDAGQLPSAREGRRSELMVFLILAVLIWPIIAVGFVSAYGFIVWLWQILLGPPGPPN